MRILAIIIGLCLISLVILAQQPDDVPILTEEQELERTKQEIEEIMQELKAIDHTRSKLETNRAKLKQIMISNNEASAMNILKTLVLACEKYRENQNLSTYPWSLQDLKGYLAEEIIDAVDVEHALYGYYYEYKYVAKDSFRIKAIPATKGETGIRTFSINQSGAILDVEKGAPATLGTTKEQ